jgi:hydrogenase maturation protease
VAGLGNPLQGSDAFGPAVVERLRRSAVLPSGTDLVDVHTDVLSQLDRFVAFDGVVLVDAVLAGSPGGVAVFSEETFASWPAVSSNCHAVSPLAAVKLFRLLQPSSRTRFVLVGLMVDRIDSRVVPDSGAVQAGVEAVVRIVIDGHADREESGARE